jgi:hypothetical protein
VNEENIDGVEKAISAVLERELMKRILMEYRR